MYDGATHCWDCRQLNGYSKKTYYGVQMYRFDEEITTDSQNAVVTFLEKFVSNSLGPLIKASETTNSNKKASSGSVDNCKVTSPLAEFKRLKPTVVTDCPKKINETSKSSSKTL